jgi:parallel beta-helix repeat protein
MRKILYGIILIVMLALIILVVKFDDIEFEEEEENDSQTQNLTDAECSSSIDCPQVSVQNYCENDSSYSRVQDYSCVDGECIKDIKEPSLVEVCSQDSECKDGVCEPISILISSCGAYLTKEGGYYELSKSISKNNLTEHCITIIKNNITFDCNGNSITSDSNYSGVYSEENKYITIKNCEITMSKDRGIGIHLYNNDYSSIINNKLKSQYRGLYLNWDTNAIINGNTIKSNTNVGILMEKSSNNEVSDNIICSNNVTDVKLIGVSNIQGTGNEFGGTDTSSDGWPVLDEHYTNCS